MYTEHHSWVLRTTHFDPETHLHDAPVNTLGNGLLGCRGFFEEQQEGIAALGGIYMAGVLGSADYIPWTGTGRELVNLPNFFWVRLRINGEVLCPTQQSVQDFSTALNLQEGTLQRSYTYYKDGVPLVQLSFLRYVSYDNCFTAAQRVEITPLVDGLALTAELGTNTNVTNLNLQSTEPHPIQPGRKQYNDVLHTADLAVVRIAQPDEITLAFAQATACGNGAHLQPFMQEASPMPCHCYCIDAPCGQTAVLEKQIALAASLYDGAEVAQVAQARLAALPCFAAQLAQHTAAMEARWQDMDIQIDGSAEDQLTLRYNLYELMVACPEHSDRYSIGARGLTGEMYEGCVFWDTEIFMLPFFTMTRPAAAKGLLAYRYHTLNQARAHAKSNWLTGAMYGWQVNPLGEEQTPQGVGAYYSIHVIADIAFALLDYWYATGDDDFMLSQGLEIAMETARFWVSRVQRRPDGTYDIMAVRGPNEYDVLVNNNLYTNLMARENMVLCRKLLTQFAQTHPEALAALQQKIGFAESETAVWQDIESNLILPYHAPEDLWLEDDCWLRRRPLDMEQAKPGGKRIIDTTIPYEALPLYQVTKQADVLHAMKNLPWYFTPAQMQTAYDHYMPKTAFDSSLSYSMFALMAARLGRGDTAERFFERTANLDLKNVQLNTISGLHFANFGGTWQTVVFGFGGVSVQPDRLVVTPHLPSGWNTLSFKLYYKGAQLAFVLSHSAVTVTKLSGQAPVQLTLCNQEICLDSTHPCVTLEVQ